MGRGKSFLNKMLVSTGNQTNSQQVEPHGICTAKGSVKPVNGQFTPSKTTKGSGKPENRQFTLSKTAKGSVKPENGQPKRSKEASYTRKRRSG